MSHHCWCWQLVRPPPTLLPRINRGPASGSRYISAHPTPPTHLGMGTLVPGDEAWRSARSVAVPSAMSCDPALPRCCNRGLSACAAATARQGPSNTNSVKLPLKVRAERGNSLQIFFLVALLESKRTIASQSHQGFLLGAGVGWGGVGWGGVEARAQGGWRGAVMWGVVRCTVVVGRTCLLVGMGEVEVVYGDGGCAVSAELKQRLQRGTHTGHAVGGKGGVQGS
jgi:hypothetical protein